MNTTIINKDNNYSLHNLENYKKNIDSTTSEITEKYYLLLLEYFKFIIENIKPKNKAFTKFIISRGLDTITNVFNSIFYYTKNLDLTYFHCQKSFYFYVEFVGQISEDEKMFLQLTSRDATTYVYKKTIFEINNEWKKKINETHSQETDNKMAIIENYMNMYKTFIYKIINNDFKENNLNIEVFEKICKKINKTHLNKENIELLNNIFDKLYFIIDDTDYFFQTIQNFLKKYKPQHLTVYEKKIYTEEILERLNETPDKMVSWLLNS
jgi:hypothetical protein